MNLNQRSEVNVALNARRQEMLTQWLQAHRLGLKQSMEFFAERICDINDAQESFYRDSLEYYKQQALQGIRAQNDMEVTQ
jgi:hypothetical protein